MNPVMVIMAAGMGSRYGGLKQMEGFGPNGELFLEYAVYDGVRAGVEKVYFVIRREFEREFVERVVRRLEGMVEVRLVYQELEVGLRGYEEYLKVRKKPWGTGHVLYTLCGEVEEDFVILNADDFYGREAIEGVVGHLREGDRGESCLAGYKVGKTLSENGKVNRGLCWVDKSGHLVEIEEHRGLVKRGDGVICDEEGVSVDVRRPVSMNLWGLRVGVLEGVPGLFEGFLRGIVGKVEGAEFYLPEVMQYEIHHGHRVRVLETQGEWHGVTYPEDARRVREALKGYVELGGYPSPLVGMRL